MSKFVLYTEVIPCVIIFVVYAIGVGVPAWLIHDTTTRGWIRRALVRALLREIRRADNYIK